MMTMTPALLRRSEDNLYSFDRGMTAYPVKTIFDFGVLLSDLSFFDKSELGKPSKLVPLHGKNTSEIAIQRTYNTE
mgnify:FL=1